MKARTDKLTCFYSGDLQFLSAVVEDAARSALAADTVKAYSSSLATLQKWLVGRELTAQSFSDYPGHVNASDRASVPSCRYNRAGP